VRYLLVTAQRQVGEPLSDYLGDPNIRKVYFLLSPESSLCF
jgi:hypothetical protein